MSDQAAGHLQKSGVEFAEIDDVSTAAMRAIADTTVNGMTPLEYPFQLKLSTKQVVLLRLYHAASTPSVLLTLTATTTKKGIG